MPFELFVVKWTWIYSLEIINSFWAFLIEAQRKTQHFLAASSSASAFTPIRDYLTSQLPKRSEWWDSVKWTTIVNRNGGEKPFDKRAKFEKQSNKLNRVDESWSIETQSSTSKNDWRWKCCASEQRPEANVEWRMSEQNRRKREKSFVKYSTLMWVEWIRIYIRQRFRHDGLTNTRTRSQFDSA